jgi:hypothetical protein
LDSVARFNRREDAKEVGNLLTEEITGEQLKVLARRCSPSLRKKLKTSLSRLLGLDASPRGSFQHLNQWLEQEAGFLLSSIEPRDEVKNTSVLLGGSGSRIRITVIFEQDPPCLLCIFRARSLLILQ